MAMLTIGRHLKPRGPGQLDPGAFIALHAVSCHEPIRPSDLAGRLQLDASTISRHVRNLEDAGYLARTPDPADRRASQVSLSEVGRTILDRMLQTRRVRVAEALSGWSQESRDQLVALVSRLAGDLERTDSETGST